MNCQDIKDLLEPLRNGELQGENLRRVREHLASCGACRSGLSPEDLMEILPVLDQSIEPTEDFKSRFYAQLQTRRSRGRLKMRSKFSVSKPGWAWRLAAACVLIALVTAGLHWRNSRNYIPDTSAVLYEIEVTENLSLLKDMALIENLELFEDLDTIENLPDLN